MKMYSVPLPSANVIGYVVVPVYQAIQHHFQHTPLQPTIAVNSSYVWPCLYICERWSADADNIEDSMRNIPGTLFIVLQAAYLELDNTFPNRTAMFSKAELLEQQKQPCEFQDL
jgi:hypothetical protein